MNKRWAMKSIEKKVDNDMTKSFFHFFLYYFCSFLYAFSSSFSPAFTFFLPALPNFPPLPFHPLFLIIQPLLLFPHFVFYSRYYIHYIFGLKGWGSGSGVLRFGWGVGWGVVRGVGRGLGLCFQPGGLYCYRI